MVLDDEIDRVLDQSPSLGLRLSRWARKWDDPEVCDDDFIPFDENARRNMLGYYDWQIDAMLANPEIRASLDEQHAKFERGEMNFIPHEEAKKMMKSWGMDFSGPPRDWIFTKAKWLLAGDDKLADVVRRQVEETPWPLNVEPPSDDMRARLVLAAGLRRAARRHSLSPQ